jgi:hypothetical protein
MLSHREKTGSAGSKKIASAVAQKSIRAENWEKNVSRERAN